MKKILSTILLLTFFISPIKADDYASEGNYQISLSYNKTPSYYVKIPTNFDCSNNESSFYFYVKGNIYNDQILNIDFSDSTVLTSDTKQVIINVSQNKKDFYSNELSDEFISSTIYLNHDNMSAGTYTGILNIHITLKGEE